jgi:hypothetical protein
VLHTAAGVAVIIATKLGSSAASAAFVLGLLQLLVSAKAVLQECPGQQAASEQDMRACCNIGHSAPYADDKCWSSQQEIGNL